MIGSESPTFTESLIENANIIGESFTNERPSACQLECKLQQSSLVTCVETVRESGDTSCMKLAIQAWTKCCTDANLSQVEEKV